jgi:hypothetical protein
MKISVYLTNGTKLVRNHAIYTYDTPMSGREGPPHPSANLSIRKERVTEVDIPRLGLQKINEVITVVANGSWLYVDVEPNE